MTIAVVANDSFLTALATDFAHELPSVVVRATPVDAADVILVADVAVALDGRLAMVFRVFPGRRLLLVAPGADYEVVGAPVR